MVETFRHKPDQKRLNKTEADKTGPDKTGHDKMASGNEVNLGLSSILTYVISFPEDDKRRAVISERLAKQTITPTFIDAVNGRTLSDAEKQQYLDPNRQNWLPRQLSAGALGCSLAHIKAWQALIASDADCALILEDDAVLSDEAAPILNKLTGRSHQFDIITLHHYKRRPRHKIEQLSSGHELSVVRYNQIGAIAYLISRQAAMRLIKEVLPISFELDVYMNRWWQHGVSNMLIYPPIAAEDGRESSIGYRQQEPEWPNDTPILKLKRRLNRALDSTKKRLGFWTYLNTRRKRWL